MQAIAQTLGVNLYRSELGEWQKVYADLTCKSRQSGNLMDTNSDGQYDPTGYWTQKGGVSVYHRGKWAGHEPDVRRSLRIFGHSWGGLSAINLAQKISTDKDFKYHNTIDVVAVIDPVDIGRGPLGSVNNNVRTFWNRYESKTNAQDEIPLLIPFLPNPHGKAVSSSSQDGGQNQQDLNPSGNAHVFGNPQGDFINHYNIIDQVRVNFIWLLLAGAT